MKQQIVSRWDSSKVLFECDVPDDLPSGLRMRHALKKAVAVRPRIPLTSADLTSADLTDADLTGAVLTSQKADFFDILLRASREVAGLRAALIAGKVDGSTYEGECACLVGTIANVRSVSFQDLGNGIKPNSSRPAERWFLGIKKGDTPKTNQISAITVGWVDEFVGLLEMAKS